MISLMVLDLILRIKCILLKGEKPIPVNLITFDSGHFTTNEDLWKFIMDKVNEIRDTIETECPELTRLT